MDKIELWRDIVGYEGLYQVSDLGRVRSLNYNRTGKIKTLRLCIGKTGYLIVNLCKNGTNKVHKVHRLVADNWIENPLPEKWDQVNHIDEDKFNNRVENLEWCNNAYNCNYGTRNERMAEKLSKPVICVETGVVYKSTMEVQRELNYSSSFVSRCCRGEQNTAYCYHWKYI